MSVCCRSVDFGNWALTSPLRIRLLTWLTVTHLVLSPLAFVNLGRARRLATQAFDIEPLSRFSEKSPAGAAFDSARRSSSSWFVVRNLEFKDVTTPTALHIKAQGREPCERTLGKLIRQHESPTGIYTLLSSRRRFCGLIRLSAIRNSILELLNLVPQVSNQ